MVTCDQTEGTAMTRTHRSWSALLDLFTAWGEADDAAETPPPTDDDLWAAARCAPGGLVPEPGRHRSAHRPAPGVPRRAATHPHRPARCRRRAGARGHHAFIRRSGHNTAALFAGSTMPDAAGVPRWSASVGPGWFDADGHGRPVADTTDCFIGPDGDNPWLVGLPPHPTVRGVSNLVIAVIEEVQTRRDRFRRAADAARAAMWAAFATQYPQLAAAGPPERVDERLRADSDKALAGWLEHHLPDATVVAARVAALAVDEDAADSPREAG
jgi:hypothetical protein